MKHLDHSFQLLKKSKQITFVTLRSSLFIETIKEAKNIEARNTLEAVDGLTNVIFNATEPYSRCNGIR